MAPKIFSKSLQEFTGSIGNLILQDSLSDLQNYLGKKKLQLFSWDEKHIAIPLKVDVELPPLGNIDNLDIRDQENIIVIINLEQYPSTAPVVHTDRLDFPKDHLAHLYIAKNGRPPAFCLVKGNIDEWYANKRLRDLVIRTKNWLRDAAVGELTENGNQFDPLRLEGYKGTVIYKHQEISDIVTQNKSFLENSNFTLGLFENTAKDENYPSFRLDRIITPETFEKTIVDYMKSLKELVESKTFKLKKFYIGYILWSKDPDTHSTYCVDLPKSWETFASFCNQYKIDLSEFEGFIATFKFHLFREIPVIVALKRPKTVIGFSSNIEFVNFYLELKDEDKSNNKIVNNIPINFQSHNEPLSTQKAQEISGSYPKIKDSIIVGCGALGSKIVLHFMRNGVTDFTLFDPDKISPHNMARHSLLAEYEGMNKAVALTRAIKNIYRHEELSDLLGIPLSGELIFSDLFKTGLKNIKWIFDFTASDSFFNTLVNTSNVNHISIIRASLSDQGNLGIMMLEGENRNPRIDDLQIILYSLYAKQPFISEWLNREFDLAKTSKVLLNVGVGCNSETIILSDYVISSHAAYFSGAIKYESNRSNENKEGKIFLNRITTDNGFNTQSHTISVSPMIITRANNDPSWEIRIKPGIIEIMKSEMGLAMPHETGGVFIGCVNYKTKTIHVVDIITAPPDSTSNPVCFYRGIDGLPDKVKEVNEGSGYQLGYIGEWHTHPFGPNGMSHKDMQTAKDFHKQFTALASPLPVFLMIATPSGILPFVY